jgi:hypothetical protein
MKSALHTCSASSSNTALLAGCWPPMLTRVAMLRDDIAHRCETAAAGGPASLCYLCLNDPEFLMNGVLFTGGLHSVDCIAPAEPAPAPAPTCIVQDAATCAAACDHLPAPAGYYGLVRTTYLYTCERINHPPCTLGSTQGMSNSQEWWVVVKVCGVDDVTYTNQCEADCAGTDVKHILPCNKPSLPVAHCCSKCSGCSIETTSGCETIKLFVCGIDCARSEPSDGALCG